MDAAKSKGSGSEEWALAHEALSVLSRRRAELDADEGRALLRAVRAGTHLHLGFATFAEYVERLFGLGPRAVEEKLRVAVALEKLPVLGLALREGALSWSAVRELSRVATAETEREWLGIARGKTAREVERFVSGLGPGDRPADPRRSEFVRHVLRFEVSAETLASFREAMKLLQKRSEHRLDDDAALLSMAREILGGPGDAGRASYQIVVSTCDRCRRGFQHAKGELIELEPEIVEMCQCDAQRVEIGNAHVGWARDDGTSAPLAEQTVEVGNAHVGLEREEQTSTSSVGRMVVVVGSARVASGPEAQADSHSVTQTVEVGNSRVDLGREEQTSAPSAEQAVEVRNAHVGLGAELRTSSRSEDAKSAEARGRARATQDTPPAVRREVFLRDHGCCVVPGCRNAMYVDLHHLDLRSEGGSHDPDNLVVLCGAHHGLAHRGRLRIDGKVSTGVRVTHADGTPYGVMPSPSLCAAGAKAFAALRNLGFSEKVARAILKRVLSMSPVNATPESLLRAALALTGRQ